MSNKFNRFDVLVYNDVLENGKRNVCKREDFDYEALKKKTLEQISFD